MFNMFTFDVLASFVLMAVVAMGRERQAEGPGHCEHCQGAGFEWGGRNAPEMRAETDDTPRDRAPWPQKEENIGVPWPF